MKDLSEKQLKALEEEASQPAVEPSHTSIRAKHKHAMKNRESLTAEIEELRKEIEDKQINLLKL